MDEFNQGEYLNNETACNKEALFASLTRITSSQFFVPNNADSSATIKVLECAPGTGNFTQFFLQDKRFEVRCEEGAQEMINVLLHKYNKDIETSPSFSIHKTDLLSGQFNPLANTYDIVFMGFFISHIPPSMFDSFFGKILSALKPHGKLVFADSYYPENYVLKHHESGVNRVSLSSQDADDSKYIITRKLISGEAYKIVKTGFSSEEIMSVLTRNGFIMERGDSCSITSSFIFGSVSKPQQ
eukprot:gene10919-12724_t